MVRIWNNRLSHYILLLIVTAALTLPGLGSISLWDIDEGLNAEAAREMLESGDWVVPTFNFKPRTAKPALLYWLQALAYQRLNLSPPPRRCYSMPTHLRPRMFLPTEGDMPLCSAYSAKKTASAMAFHAGVSSKSAPSASGRAR